MKTLIKLGFYVWRLNHCGMRRIVDSRRHKLHRLVAFHIAMTIRHLVMVYLGGDNENTIVGGTPWNSY